MDKSRACLLRSRSSRSPARIHEGGYKHAEERSKFGRVAALEPVRGRDSLSILSILVDARGRSLVEEAADRRCPASSPDHPYA